MKKIKRKCPDCGSTSWSIEHQYCPDCGKGTLFDLKKGIDKMSKEKITLEEWGNRFDTGQYIVLDFNYDIGTTWVLDTTNGLTYAVTYANNYLEVKEENYTMGWE